MLIGGVKMDSSLVVSKDVYIFKLTSGTYIISHVSNNESFENEFVLLFDPMIYVLLPVEDVEEYEYEYILVDWCDEVGEIKSLSMSKIESYEIDESESSIEYVQAINNNDDVIVNEFLSTTYTIN